MPPFTHRLEEALVYAAQVHRDQFRKAAEVPYIIHLLGVAAIVGDYGGSEDQVIAALLHDAPEDQGGRERLEDIRRRFGENVARIVEGCTDTFETPKPAWRQRKERYIAHLRHAPAEVRLVSAADKLHNTRTIIEAVRQDGDAVFERFNGKKVGTLWYYPAIVEALEANGPHSLVAELRRAVNELLQLSTLTPSSTTRS
jgi:GTP pyrophosphokinase